MKYLLLFAILFGSFGVFGQKKVRVFLDQKQFYAPTVGNYLELQFEYDAASLNFKGVENGLMAEVAVNLVIQKSGTEIKREGFRLSSPVMRDSIVENFFDIRRFALEPGSYLIDLRMFDVNAEDNGVSAQIPVYMREKGKEPSFSTIQLIEHAAASNNPASPFFKSGLDIVPRMSTYFPEDLKSLPYYIEVYGTNHFSRPSFGVRQRIIDATSEKEIADLTKFYKLDTGSVVPMVKKIDLSSLYTGSYQLELTLLNGEMEEMSQVSSNFERTNEPDIQILSENVILDPNFEASITRDSALFYLGSLIPISKAETQRILINSIKENNPERALKTIQSFWVATSGATGAYGEWMKYKEQVNLVQKIYKTNFQDGYETDRGRVYLQYGSPTTTVQRDASASEYPYEIWQYNKIGQFSNKRFIFYNPDLVGNNYNLLHSDMIGEIRNNNWPLALNQRNTTRGTTDDPNQDVQRHYGGNSNDLFRQY